VDAHRTARPRLTARGTNLALLAALLLAYLSGAASEAVGAPGGWWVTSAHGAAALLVVAVLPAKRRVVVRGLRRARATRGLSVVLAGLLVATLLTGLASVTGLVRTVGSLGILWLLVAAALVTVPLLLWHALARPARLRRTDLSRRTALRAGALGAVSVAGLGGSELLVAGLGLPGATRRFTGSVEVPTPTPTSWLDDRAPAVDGATWRLRVVDAEGTRRLSLAELAGLATTRRATLDCTSGWYSEQEWTGVSLATLLPDVGTARSLLVHSATGYSVRLPVTDLGGLLLATSVAGEPLGALHGYPARLVAPGRRGFWWVKWVDRLELSATPAWWRSPFPLT